MFRKYYVLYKNIKSIVVLNGYLRRKLKNLRNHDDKDHFFI